MCLPEGVCEQGVYTSLPPWTELLTHACENITFPQLRVPQLLLRTVTIVHVSIPRPAVQTMCLTHCCSIFFVKFIIGWL